MSVDARKGDGHPTVPHGSQGILPGIDRETLVALREADEPQRYRELGLDSGTFRRLKRADLIKLADTEYDPAQGHNYRFWEVIEATRVRAGQILDSRSSAWPRCDHRFAIVHDPVDDPDVGDFKCPAENCDERYTRETVERVRQERARDDGGESA